MTDRRHALGGLAAGLAFALVRPARAGDLDDMLLRDPDTPVLGNPAGDVTVVEFFDYRCPYCRQSAQAVHDLIAGDAGVRVLMKEWPILGKKSVIAARGALAAHRQGRYADFHWSIMLGDGDTGRDRVVALAGDLGLDLAAFEADMESEAVTAMLARNDRVATGLGLTGTPGFVVGQRVVPGAVPLDTLRDFVAEARSAT